MENQESGPFCISSPCERPSPAAASHRLLRQKPLSGGSTSRWDPLGIRTKRYTKCYRHRRESKDSQPQPQPPKKHRAEPSAPLTLTLQGGGAMHGGGAASPDAAICISPEAGPIVGVAPAGISKFAPQPFLPLSPNASHSLPIRAISDTILLLPVAYLSLVQLVSSSFVSRVSANSSFQISPCYAAVSLSVRV